MLTPAQRVTEQMLCSRSPSCVFISHFTWIYQRGAQVLCSRNASLSIPAYDRIEILNRKAFKENRLLLGTLVRL